MIAGAAAIALALLLCAAPAVSQSSAGTAPPASAAGNERAAASRTTALFESSDILELTLRTDMRTLFRDRDSVRRVVHDGTITKIGSTGEQVTIPLQLRTRGHFRRQAWVCNTPPLQMRFRGRGSRNTAFEGQRNLKLVVQCRNRDEFEQFLLREYLVYRTFNLLTDRSFRARLLRLTWEDAAGRQQPETQYAFVIESEEELGRRLGGMHVLDQKGALDGDLDPEQTALVDMFQFFIGNTDWSIAGLHNMRLFWYRDGRLPYPIPYDFDWSGLVEATYARPDARLPIANVRTRLYRGACRNPEDMAAVIQLFEEKRPEIEALWSNAEGLSDRSKRRALDYFNEFYRTVNNRGALRREMSADCRKP